MKITRVYPKEYKLEAVRIYVESGKGYWNWLLTILPHPYYSELYYL